MNTYVQASVLKPISLPTNPLTVIPKDTQLLVDTQESVAYYNGMHFDIAPDEYSTTV